MADTGWLEPGSTKQDFGGVVMWSNLNNIKVDDTSSASASWSAASSTRICHAYNFPIDLPAGSTIDGCEAEWEQKRTGGATLTTMSWSDTTTTFGATYDTTGATTSAVTVNVGGPTSLDMGFTVNQSVVENTGFGVQVGYQSFVSGTWAHTVEFMRVKIYYTAPITFKSNVVIL